MLFCTFLLAFATFLIGSFASFASYEEIRKLKARVDQLERNARSSSATAGPTRATPAAAIEPVAARSEADPSAGTVADALASERFEARLAAQASTNTNTDTSASTSTSSLGGANTPEKTAATIKQAVDAPEAATEPAAPSAVGELADSLLRVIRRNPFASAGVIMFMIGLGFLFSLLAVHDILTPVMRVGLVAAAGTAVFVTGLKQEKKRLALGWNLEGGALAIEYLCVLWSFSGYHLITPETAFVLLGALSTLAYGFAVLKKGLAFAFMGMAGGLVTPIVTSTGHGEYSALVLYCVFIVWLSISTGRYLKSISLSTVTYLAVTALLGSALGSATGNPGIVIAGCSVMSFSFLSFALVLCLQDRAERGFDVGAAILLMLMPPVSNSLLLQEAVQLSAAQAALLPALSAALVMLGVWRASTLWRPRLVAVVAILSFVAIGMRFHGSEHAVAVAATALTLILAGRFMKSTFVSGLGCIYWVLSSIEAASSLADGHPFSMYCAALVALAAGFVWHGEGLGLLYILAAPVLLAGAVLDRFGVTAAHFTLFMLGWTVLSAGLARSHWPDFRWGAAWLVPAGAFLLLGPEWTETATLWIERDLLLSAWLLVSLVWLFHTMPSEVAANARQIRYNALFLILPLAVTIEVVRILSDTRVDDRSGIAAALALTWSLAGMIRQKGSRAGQAGTVEICNGVALSMAAMSILLTTFSPLHEMVLLATFGIVLSQFKGPLEGAVLIRKSMAVWLLAAFVAGAGFQGIGLWQNLDQPVFELLVQGRMQPYVSMLWATAGITVVVVGSRLAARDLWFAGSALLALLIAKMFGVDLVSLTLAEKVATFMAVGVGLIALGYFCPLPPSSGELLSEREATGP